METGQHKAYGLAIQHIYQSQRNGGSHKTEDNTLNGEGRANEEVRGTDQFHDGNLVASHRNTNRNRVADQENGDCQQNNDNGCRHIAKQLIECTQRLGG